MKYLLLVTWDAAHQNAQPDPEPAAVSGAAAGTATATAEEEPMPWVDELRARDQWLIGDQLAPPRRARTVRVREGRRHVTDGPFTETKEAIGGFDLIEADSLDEAVEIASRHPVAAIGAIEVRPLIGG
ncbi:MAG TPA: YciI family protein [Candidatus Limnocylindrales bacterium]|nr:YciI family protein [Candidatus Limnocylindrales bacterium]